MKMFYLKAYWKATHIGKQHMFNRLNMQEMGIYHFYFLPVAISLVAVPCCMHSFIGGVVGLKKRNLILIVAGHVLENQKKKWPVLSIVGLCFLLSQKVLLLLTGKAETLCFKTLFSTWVIVYLLQCYQSRKISVTYCYKYSQKYSDYFAQEFWQLNCFDTGY